MIIMILPITRLAIAVYILCRYRMSELRTYISSYVVSYVAACNVVSYIGNYLATVGLAGSYIAC